MSKVGRPATGSLVWTKTGWAARITTTIDGERVRVQRQLDTTSKAAAQRKLERLLEADNPTPAEAARVETFEEAARRIVAHQRTEGLKTWSERLSRLERFAFAELGALPVPVIRPSHVRAVLDGAAKQGRSRTTCSHLKDDISTVLGELWRDEVVSENVALRVTVPKSAAVDDRQRVILSDEEFARFMACPDVGPELHTMALVSRTVGGMRTSDLHAWDWSHVDTQTWLDAHVPRPKTKTKDRLALPAVLLPILQTWWDRRGRPVAGPVFPVRRGARAGERKSTRNSYAKALRDALWLAGIVRPLPGFFEVEVVDGDEEAAEAERRKLCLIQAGSEEHRPLDFHSFRRAYNTGLASAGVNVQQAMRLAGHRNASTHMKYVQLSESLEAPEEALPRIPALSAPKLETPAPPTPRIPCAPTVIRTQDLRLRRPTLYPAELWAQEGRVIDPCR